MNERKTPKKGSIGRLLIIILIVVIGGLFGKNTVDEKQAEKELQRTENVQQVTESPEQQVTESVEITYQFRNEEYLQEHFEKHGDEFDYVTKENYLKGANRVLQDEDVLHKIEAEDGDDVYYLEETNELVIVSGDGYIRTYFKPEDGIAYYNRQ